MARSQLLVDKIVDIGTFIITAVLSSGSSGMSENLQKALNALRCAFLNGFGNSAYLLAAGIYFAAQVQQLEIYKALDEGIKYLDEYYPYLCTCEKDKKNIEEFMGATGQSMANFKSCAEQDFSEDGTDTTASS
jgi:hypothetical protein